MTGHQANNQSHGTNPLRIQTPTLNQQAANLAQARNENNPYIRDLAHIEPRFIAELLRRLDTPDIDHTLIGAILLTAGQLAGQIVEMIRPEAQQHAAPMLTNLLQLAGQQLYMGKLDHAAPCPYPLATGKPCNYLAKADTADQLDAVMRGHLAIHHPDHTWPVTANSEITPKTDTDNAFPESGRQIYVAFETQWAGLAVVVDKLGWMLCEIPLDPNAPDHDGIPTYCLQPKPTAEATDVP